MTLAEQKQRKINELTKLLREACELLTAESVDLPPALRRWNAKRKIGWTIQSSVAKSEMVAKRRGAEKQETSHG